MSKFPSQIKLERSWKNSTINRDKENAVDKRSITDRDRKSKNFLDHSYNQGHKVGAAKIQMTRDGNKGAGSKLCVN